MTKYALFTDGSFVEVRNLAKKPDPNPAKKHKWYAVGPSVEGDIPGWTVQNSNAVETIAKPTTPPRRSVGSFSEFMGLFTESQQLAIDVAATPGTALSLMLKRATASNEIDLTAQIVVDAMALLVARGLITEAEKAAILGVDFDAAT